MSRMRVACLGPVSYQNWKVMLQGADLMSAAEFPLFTDAQITGDLATYGPYLLLNALNFPPFPEYKPGAFLRIDDYIRPDDMNLDLNRTDATRYHGGTLPEEIAALLSLCLGVRLKAGGCTRVFNSLMWEDPRGHPVGMWRNEDPALPRLSTVSPVVLPGLAGTHNLEEAAIMGSYPRLSGPQAVALVRSARLYQNALWIAEPQPELSWILLVSAIEVATGHCSSEKDDPVAELREFKPELAALLSGHGDNGFVRHVAEMIYVGSTRKFANFVIGFLPDPPNERPPKEFQHPWDEIAMRKSMSIIYDLRSRALHDGTPFPLPMCEAPKMGEETLLGSAAGGKGGAWLAKDAPMLLHTFAHIVRGSLLRWWRSMACAGDRGSE